MLGLHETMKVNANDSRLLLPYSLFKHLKILRTSRTLKCGISVHGRIITQGLMRNLQLRTALIFFYLKLLDMETARKVFDEMPGRNVVSWTAMISGYCHVGNNVQALLMFAQMHRSRVRGNEFTYGSTLQACTRMRCLHVGLQVLGCIEKEGFANDIIVQSALIDLHSKCGKMEDARVLFETMSKRDTVAWNSIIGGYATHESFTDSVQLFQLMIREGMTPDCFTLGSVLRACVVGGSLKQVIQIHKYVIQLGFTCYMDLTGSLVDAYAKCGDVRYAHNVYKKVRRNDLICCTALITAYARKGDYNDNIIDLFREVIEMMHADIDVVMLCTVLHVCANATLLSLGRQIHAFASKKEPNLDTAFGNALVDMYAKSGEIKDAKRAFDEMKVKNVISWTSLIGGYGRHGFGDEALALYKKMEFEGLKPNDVTFLCLLSGCSHSGLTGEGWECFNNMIKKYKFSPRVEHLSCMVDLCARAGQLEEAHRLIQEMNVEPNASCWGAILGASRFYGSVPHGETAGLNLFSMDPENAANYVNLASIYAEAGALDDAWRINKMMGKRDLKKEAAYSFLLQSSHKRID